ncbi:MAG: NAD-dependent epimerase/dehydratase family protein [Planctomycetota bacterium]|jgi:nucleoside-diphosphate-sugar epimerase
MASRVLVIGGTRFLGLAIIEGFLNKGYDVYEMNRGSRPKSEGVTEQLVCDKSDRDAFAAALKKHHWDVIVDTILDHKDISFVVETLGPDIGHFIHTGSLGVYGKVEQIPVRETRPLEEYDGKDIVVFNYKIAQDRVLFNAFNESAFPGTVLRMSYIYGPGDVLLDGWGGREPEFFKMMEENKKISLPGDGTSLLHPGHVKDLGRSFVCAAENKISIGQAYNIAGHYALMNKDYIARVAKEMGVAPEIEYLAIDDLVEKYPEKASKRGAQFLSQHMCASIEKAERDLGWKPEITLEVGIRDSVAWMRENIL